MEFASLIFFFLIIIPSAIIHEYMHGAVANYFGDPTAKYAGRLTLNPAAHIDAWGTFLLPAMLFLLSDGRFLFAYAKPVPVNPLLLRGRYAGIIVAAAGPLSNKKSARRQAVRISCSLSDLGPVIFPSRARASSPGGAPSPSIPI
jgi:Zn-dependent protease